MTKSWNRQFAGCNRLIKYAAHLITGRHRLGPANADWQLVVFHDYYCQDCADLHKILPQLQLRYTPSCLWRTAIFPELAVQSAILHGKVGRFRRTRLPAKRLGLPKPRANCTGSGI
ncbi:MAG: hypothetical protein R3C49_21650 [Planctomycetaceae bacterium]